MIKSPYRDERGNIIDYYAVLHIPYQAKKEMIRTAFCNLIKLYHPDVSGKTTEKEKRITNMLIDGYKVLSDDKLRKEYNRELFSRLKFSKKGYVYVPRSRVKYSYSLKDLLYSRLLGKKQKHKDRLYHIGQDVEIFVTPQELSTGAIAVIELPARTSCYVCYGENRECHACRGVGRIPSAAHLEVEISPGTKDGTVVDVDLMKMSPDRFTTFTMKSLRVKILVAGKARKPAAL